MSYASVAYTAERKTEMNATCQECSGACCKIWFVSECSVDADERVLLEMRGVMVAPALWVLHAECRNLGKNGRCMIYPDRPKACHDFKVDGPSCKTCKDAWNKLRAGGLA